jgi:hypothetical protein
MICVVSKCKYTEVVSLHMHTKHLSQADDVGEASPREKSSTH